ncbi:MAG: hypothetical protein C4532_00410 [Candidatus Abyssobacteria bacterium SURF_17]|uniref:DUF4350 domain-containing protein n=1 Tax=Candidatus Abyssobacteria bacterium SURF_17 TaxID=2093361 RepID=A0A419FA63_9BACT|nr:MAG: hypothetical protein C4532_00410 [Candidatus Abyssubacteria bacterium SURF_17]
MKKMRFGLAAFTALLLCTNAFGQGKKVLIFEPAMALTDTTFSAEPSGYSKLVDMLRQEGLLVASMSSGEITQHKLTPYDIVALHPSPERPLSENEISALVWFVVQKGGALFIHGGTARIINPLAEIFGISMDESALIDVTSNLEEAALGRSFILSRFHNLPALKFDEIQRISFHGGAPLVLSQDAAAIVTGDDDCYSDNGLYSIGSLPPVAAVAYVGRGLILVKSDRTMLDNKNIEAYQNMQWAKAVFQQLASAPETAPERDRSLLSLRSQLSSLEQQLSSSTEKLKKYESDLTASYERAKSLQAELQSTQEQKETLAAQLQSVQSEKNKLSTTLAKYRSPETLKTIGIAAAVVALVLFLFGFFVGRRTMRNRV